MDILSYRGPASAGGVSSALSRIVQTCSDSNEHWWHLSQAGLLCRALNQPASHICNIPTDIVDGHYRYCNNFLWPILHDMPEFAHYSKRDRESYQKLNLAFAHNILKSDKRWSKNEFFIQDYQLALMPEVLATIAGAHMSVFWHIPWPKSVQEEHVGQIAEIAQALLNANKLGFHTEEYAINFLRFVEKHLKQYHVDFISKRITKAQKFNSKTVFLSKYTGTELIVHPLGLDLDFWEESIALEELAEPNPKLEAYQRLPFLLSVDRADYTKGVIQRLDAIDHFFENFPQMRKEVSFVQICQASRVGLPAFDRYWQKCQKRIFDLNQKWAADDWAPLISVEEPLTASELAHLYSNAVAMLVTPVRDGLNLTAKEFVACSNDSAALLLSPGAGAFHELGDQALAAAPSPTDQLALQINNAITMPVKEKQNRLKVMRGRIRANTLSKWWYRFKARPGNVSELVQNNLQQRTRRNLSIH